MGRVFVSMVAGVSFLIAGTAAVGKPPQPSSKKSEQALVEGMNAVVATDSQTQALQAQAKEPKPDHDQGDDNASDRAKEVVCTKDTPAAERSAICDGFVSPE